MSLEARRGQRGLTSGGAMVSPFQGTPNIPLQLDSMTKECLPALTASRGIMYSTRRSPPNPPVMPCNGVPSVVNIIASHPGSNSTVERVSCDGARQGVIGLALDPFVLHERGGDRE